MRHTWLALLLPICLFAKGWDPIPPDVWALKASSPEGASGAIFLTDNSRYGLRDTEHWIRILILSESGKAAAQFAPFPNQASLEGRTVYPDGREVTFNRAQDFATQEIRAGQESAELKVVIPPGLTDHCIVDLHWKEPITFLWDTRFDRDILRPYPIRHLELRLSSLSNQGSVWFRPVTLPMESVQDGDYRVFTFRNLPAIEPEPYSRVAWLLRPKLVCFLQPDALLGSRRNPDIYWRDYASKIERPFFQNRLRKGRHYTALAAEILKDLPADPEAKARAITGRLQARILNVSQMTQAERAARTKRQDHTVIEALDLNESADRRWTNGGGIFYLAYQLFTDAGLRPMLLLVANRDIRGFRYDLMDAYQFDDILLGIPVQDGKDPLWCDPSARLLPFGTIAPSYQGTQGLVVDPREGTAKAYWVPVQAPPANRETYRFEVTPGPEADAFKIHADFAGIDEWVAKSKVFQLSPGEAEKQLKEKLEASDRFHITRVSVLHATDLDQPVSWEAEGTRETDGGRHRQVVPFPTEVCPLWIPSDWPEHRIDPIVMAYASDSQSTSRIQIPEGWRATLPGNSDQHNQFGRVVWQAHEVQETGGKAVQVTYEVTVSKVFSGPEADHDLRDFLSWVQDTWSRTISLERAR